MTNPYEPPLNVELHLKYWRRCFRSLLPHHYLPNESNRMALAFFMVGSADLLSSSSAREPLIAPETKPRLREWVLAQQHAGGGFCGSPSVTLPPSLCQEWDFEAGQPGLEPSGLANLPATVFALQLLASLARDDAADAAWAGVDRVKTLRWLARLQRPDGSFGEELVEMPGHGWFIGGGYDMRLCYLAALVRWMLRGDVQKGDPGWVEDFDTDKMIKHISRAQTYDGGLAGNSKDEPHAGYAYCAISALSLLDRPLEYTQAPHDSQAIRKGIRDIPALVHWLASRQLLYLEREDDDEDEDNSALPTPQDSSTSNDKTALVGFNGRCNKVADSCYTWWTAGTLASLGYEGFVEVGAARRFLLEKTQHAIGGFGKKPGSPPDVYHSFFSLAVLSIMGDLSLQTFDTTLAVTKETVKKMVVARAGLLGQNANEKDRLAQLSKLNRGEVPAWLDALCA